MIARQFLPLLIAMAPLTAATGQVQGVGSAQTTSDEDPYATVPMQQQTPLQTNQAGQVGTSAIGQAGQRQTRESTAQEAGIKPSLRIASRIQNRVQSRLRTRIDRYYDPELQSTDPFAVADDQLRKSTTRR